MSEKGIIYYIKLFFIIIYKAFIDVFLLTINFIIRIISIKFVVNVIIQITMTYLIAKWIFITTPGQEDGYKVIASLIFGTLFASISTIIVYSTMLIMEENGRDFNKIFKSNKLIRKFRKYKREAVKILEEA